jgi:hypothetical protein
MWAPVYNAVACAEKCLIAGSATKWVPVGWDSTFSIQVSVCCTCYYVTPCSRCINDLCSAVHRQACNVDGDLLTSGGHWFRVQIYPIDVPRLKTAGEQTPLPAIDPALATRVYDHDWLNRISDQLAEKGFWDAQVTEYGQLGNPTGTCILLALFCLLRPVGLTLLVTRVACCGWRGIR